MSDWGKKWVQIWFHISCNRYQLLGISSWVTGMLPLPKVRWQDMNFGVPPCVKGTPNTAQECISLQKEHGSKDEQTG